MPVVLAITAIPCSAALTIEESVSERGVYTIRRNGIVVVEDIRAEIGHSSAVKTFYSEKLGARIWNRWSENREDNFRFEVVERSDDSIELTMIGHCDVPVRNCRRGISFRLPAECFAGKRWQAKLGDRRSGKDGEGTFDGDFGAFTTRFLATNGLVFDLDALGPGIYISGSNGVTGEWTVSPDGAGGAKISGVSGLPAEGGGTAGAKLIIREGEYADYSRYHFFNSFYLYWQRLFPKRLVKFGAPKSSEHYVEGNRSFAKDAGWLDEATGEVRVGAAGGVYYSHAQGMGRATYRIADLARGYHILTLQIGNWTGDDNAFSVAVNGEKLTDEISVGVRKARTIAKALFVEDGKVDVTFDGRWIISGIGVQPLMSESEDYSIRRGFWFADGYEPSPVYGNDTAKCPFKSALLDQTIDMPEAGGETATAYREPPLPVELPDMQSKENAWVREIRMRKILGNGSTLTVFADEAYRDRVFRETAEKYGYNAILQNGQLSRHTYARALDAAATRTIAECVKTARKYGLRYLDHLDTTLLWNLGGYGFRLMMERLDEVQLDMYDNLPSFYLCPENPTVKRRLFDYLRNEVKAGVDGFQLDELTFWHHGCVCATCRERFHRETGWWLPLDETEGSSRWDSQTPLAKRRRDWQMKTLTNWRVDLRRYVKDLNPNLLMSAYSTYGSMTKRPSALSSLSDGARVMNLFGTEVMPRDPLRCSRPLMPLMRVKGMFCKAYGTPAWNWFYSPDDGGAYYSWALATMVGEAPLVSPLRSDPSVPDFVSWTKTARAMDPVGAKPIARVGILLSASSIDNDTETDVVSEAFGLAQELEALHVPYEFFGEMFSKWEDVKQYDVLFLGSSRCMSDRTKWLVEALIRDGRRVYGRPGCGTLNEWGEAWEKPLVGYRVMPSAAAFYASEINHDGVWNFSADAVEEAAFRQMLAGLVDGATVWAVKNVPDQVQTSLCKERSGATVIHFLNATGCTISKGERLCLPKPKTTFPPLEQDIAFELPEDVGNRVVAISPDFVGERELHFRHIGNGRISVTLPKECLKVYTLVRFSRLATIILDSDKVVGPVKPVNGVGQPPMIGELSSWSMMHYLKEAGIPYSRLHDVGGWMGKGLYVDIPNLFRNFDADENDERNYSFAYTDSLIAALVKNGVEPFFRLGVTIENFAGQGYPAVRTVPPKDPAKWARICEHVIRHYTEGWANGFHHNIRYWEIWNEPENFETIEKNAMWKGDWKSFCDFYAVVAPYLKSRFPNLKIGGYGSCGFAAASGTPWAKTANSTSRCAHFVICAKEFMKRAQMEKWPLDFFSFHSYSAPEYVKKEISYADELLGEYGFTRERTERIFDEWLPYANRESLGTARQAAAIAAVLAILQKGPCDLACLYDARCGVGAYSPLFNPLTYKPHKAYYVFTAFNVLRQLGTAVKAASDEKHVQVVAAAKDGRLALMIANPMESGVELTLPRGFILDQCLLTDETHTAELVSTAGVLPPHAFALITGQCANCQERFLLKR